MSILKHTHSIEIKNVKDSSSCVRLFFSNIQNDLQTEGYSTEFCNNTLIFKRLVRNTTHSGMNKVEALKVFREGLFRIEIKAPDIIEIYCEVSLEHLLFFSCLTGLIIGCIVMVNSNIVIAFFIAILIALLNLSIGRYLIQSNIDNIIGRQIKVLK